MYFPKFWYRAHNKDRSCWRWSDTSVEDAKAQAEDALRFSASKPLIKGGKHDWYGYPDRPLREEILEEIPSTTSGSPAAIITRNGYGAHVLNAARVPFIDIDLSEDMAEQDQSSKKGFWKRLFSGKPSLHELRTATHSKIQEWSMRNSSWGVRMYDTAGGIRLLITHELKDPSASDIQALSKELNADPKYSKLCVAQGSFRARLTPKPWRCGLTPPPCRWPWESRELQSKFQAWEEEYQSTFARHATCALVTQLGNPQIHPEIEPILELHDKRCKVGSNLPLA